MILTREQILKTCDYETRDVAVPEWGGATVRIRSLSLRERGILFDRPPGTNAERATTVAMTVAFAAIDEQGNPLFAPEDAEALAGKSPQALDRLANEILILSGIVKPEDLEKNSEPAPTAG